MPLSRLCRATASPTRPAGPTPCREATQHPPPLLEVVNRACGPCQNTKTAQQLRCRSSQASMLPMRLKAAQSPMPERMARANPRLKRITPPFALSTITTPYCRSPIHRPLWPARRRKIHLQHRLHTLSLSLLRRPQRQRVPLHLQLTGRSLSPNLCPPSQPHPKFNTRSATDSPASSFKHFKAT